VLEIAKFHQSRNRVPHPTLNKNIKNHLASENQLPTFEKKQLNKNTI